MKLSQSLLALVSSTASVLQGVNAQNNTTASTIDYSQYPEGGLNLTAWALTYSYPLAIFSSWAGGVLRNVSVNQILHQRTLADPANPGVIKPNVDTLYSRVVLDLSTNDVVLTIPNITDRYYVYPVYDPYGNSLAELGVINGNKPGNYLIRRAEDVAAAPGLANSTTAVNGTTYQGIVNLPTTYGTLLIRILLLQNTTADLDKVHTYQNASGLHEIARSVQAGLSTKAPALNTTSINNGTLLGLQGPQQTLEFAARIFKYNQPIDYTDRARVAGILARAGLYNGHYQPISGVNLTQAAALANASITAYVQNATNVRQEGNGWQLQTPANQGYYDTRYPSAAYVALYGYQQLTTRQALYPGYNSLGFTTNFNLAANTSLLVTFSAKPKLKQYGFWSLTVYGSDQYLIPNPVGRYTVGDRTTSIAYSGGRGPVYAANATDGSYQILLQSPSITPPANWTTNWLPVSQAFSWIVRWYVPQDAMTNGSYVYPTVQTIAAIRA